MIIVMRHGGLQDFMVILRPNKREETWTLLESLKHNNQIPWLCIGDFNEITSSSEKAGGNIRQARQMDKFRRVIHHCVFQDLGFVGPRSCGQKIMVRMGGLGLG
ncbi:hypothetical protein ACB092_11G127700 [Castanea dentata]